MVALSHSPVSSPLPQLLWALLLAVALTACSEPPRPPLRIATNTWVGYEPFYLARKMGMFADQDIRLVELISAADVLHALRNDLVEGAAITLDEALLLRSEGVDLHVVLALDVSDGADALVARAGIEDLQQLRGRRIGYENTAVGAFMLDAALEKAGLIRYDVVPVPVSADEHVAAFRRHKVDAVVTFEPMISTLKQAGGHVLFSSAQIPAKITDVLVVRGDVTGRALKDLQQLMRCWFNTVEYIGLNPQLAYAAMGERYRISGDEMHRRMAGVRLLAESANRELFLGPTAQLKSNTALLADTMLQHDLLQRMPNLNRLITTYPLETL